MPKLRVTIHGQVLSELKLQLGQEYFAGRGSQSHILLSNERGISRQHLKFYHDGSSWVAQLVSKYGGMVHNGQSVESLVLNDEAHFAIPPYDFYYFENADTSAQTAPTSMPMPSDIEAVAENVSEEQPAEGSGTPNPLGLPSTTDPLAGYDALEVDSGDHKNGDVQMVHDSTVDKMDVTAVGHAHLTAYLKIINRKTNSEEVLKLDGHMWTIGRHASCEVAIEDSTISRKHFDLTRTTEGFILTPHETTNSTRVNGDKIPVGRRHKIQSGDTIKIRHVEIHFELHDGSYLEKLDSLPALTEVADDERFQTITAALPAIYNAPAVVKIPPPSARQGLRPTHLMIGLGALVVVYGLFFTGPAQKPQAVSGAKDEASQSDFDKMTPDKKNEVVDTFNLAQNYYVQRKYVLCMSQVEKLHGMVAFHANSKELESLCKQARELEQIEADRRRKEEARIEAENAIRKVVEECRKIVTKTTTSDQLNACLASAIELDPQHGLITDLQSQVLIQENEKLERENQRQEAIKRKQAGQAIYNRAQGLEKSGQYKAAINEYKRFLAGRYSELGEEGDSAKRSISSIEQTLDQKFRTAVNECQSAFERGQIKETLIACEKSLQQYPDNKQIKAVKEKALDNIGREMKPIYEDSRIEESLGNIEAAKEKWQRIVEKSVPQDPYYQKAKNSLRKYGL